MNKYITLEELGYKKYENHPNQEINEPTFTTQDTPIIEYKQEDATSIEEITFNILGEIVWFKGFRKDINIAMPCPINMQELQAIYNKCKELGWFDD